MTYDGGSISLYPSIGNWNFDCKSHYWIRKKPVRWSRRWANEEIRYAREQDRYQKEKYFNEGVNSIDGPGKQVSNGKGKLTKSIVGRIRGWWLKHWY